MSNEKTMGHYQPRPELSSYLSTIARTSSVRRKDHPPQSLDLVQYHLEEATGKRIPFETLNLFGLHTSLWVRVPTHPSVGLFINSPQEESDTISVSNADQTVCIVPSANKNAGNEAYAVKIAGIARNTGGEPRILAANFTAHTGALTSLSYSASEADSHDPEKGRPFPRYSYVSHTPYQGYNQIVTPVEKMQNSLQADGLITDAMVDRTGHPNMIRPFQPQRFLDPSVPFKAPDNLYVPEIRLFVQHDQNRKLVCVGQMPADLENDWQAIINDSLYLADPTNQGANINFDPDMYPPFYDTRRGK